MNKMTLIFCFTINVLSSSSNLSHALINEDAAIDSHGAFIRDSYGNCVRTKWSTVVDPCAPVVTKVAKQHIAHKIMGMEERKIFFAFDKADIEPSEKAKLQVIADALKEHNITKVKIVGYTDKIGSEGYNQALSEKRANAAKVFLDSLVELESSVVEVRGLGKSHQLVDCPGIKERDKLIDCLSPNRRVEVEVDYYDIKSSN